MKRQAIALLIVLLCSVHYVHAGDLVLSLGYHVAPLAEPDYEPDEIDGRNHFATFKAGVAETFGPIEVFGGWTHFSDPRTEDDHGINMLGLEVTWRMKAW